MGNKEPKTGKSGGQQVARHAEADRQYNSTPLHLNFCVPISVLRIWKLYSGQISTAKVIRTRVTIEPWSSSGSPNVYRSRNRQLGQLAAEVPADLFGDGPISADTH
jgi:hypothetical protein